MPMYEYECTGCGAHFDMLRGMNQDDADITCPTCGQAQIQRRLSVFASVSKEGSTSLPASVDSGGGCCTGGMCGCSLN